MPRRHSVRISGQPHSRQASCYHSGWPMQSRAATWWLQKIVQDAEQTPLYLFKVTDQPDSIPKISLPKPQPSRTWWRRIRARILDRRWGAENGGFLKIQVDFWQVSPFIELSFHGSAFLVSNSHSGVPGSKVSESTEGETGQIARNC